MLRRFSQTAEAAAHLSEFPGNLIRADAHRWPSLAWGRSSRAIPIPGRKFNAAARGLVPAGGGFACRRD